MKRAHVLAAVAGLLLAGALVVYFGAGAILGAVTSAGWTGLAVVSAIHMAALFVGGLGWNAVLRAKLDKPLRTVFWARYVRDSLGNLIGLIPATGEIAAARELTFHGVVPATAAASAIVDLTADLISQIIFTVTGILVLLVRGADAAVTYALIAGLVIAGAIIAGFVVMQRRGLFSLLEKIPERAGFAKQYASLFDERRLQNQTEAIYKDGWRMPLSIALHFLSWLVSALETWFALLLLGSPVSLIDAIALESLVFAARTAAFFVPWGAGVQEGGYVLIGSLLGIAPGTSLALAVLKRARELVTGAPGLLLWQAAESRRLLRARVQKQKQGPA